MARSNLVQQTCCVNRSRTRSSYSANVSGSTFARIISMSSPNCPRSRIRSSWARASSTVTWTPPFQLRFLTLNTHRTTLGRSGASSGPKKNVMRKSSVIAPQSTVYSFSMQAADRIAAIQQALREAGLDGWLFYDFRGSDPLAARILKLDPARHMTRRWYYLIPAQGVPQKLLHRIEPHSLDDVPGESRLYLSWQEQHEHLRRMLQALSEGKSEAPAQLGRARGPAENGASWRTRGGRVENGASETAPAAARAPAKIAMQYSPLNAVPYISRVDAGTIELVRSLGVEVVTSADLVQRFEAVWTKDQYASHCEAAAKLRQIVDDAFVRVREEVVRGATFTERDLQQDILARITARGMHTYAPPIAAVNAHAADPHYSPPENGSSPIERGDLVLIDLWAKNTAPGSMYGDIT